MKRYGAQKGIVKGHLLEGEERERGMVEHKVRRKKGKGEWEEKEWPFVKTKG